MWHQAAVQKTFSSGSSCRDIVFCVVVRDKAATKVFASVLHVKTSLYMSVKSTRALHASEIDLVAVRKVAMKARHAVVQVAPDRHLENDCGHVASGSVMLGSIGLPSSHHRRRAGSPSAARTRSGGWWVRWWKAHQLAGHLYIFQPRVSLLKAMPTAESVLRRAGSHGSDHLPIIGRNGMLADDLQMTRLYLRDCPSRRALNTILSRQTSLPRHVYCES